jgi:hypothetical protein
MRFYPNLTGPNLRCCEPLRRVTAPASTAALPPTMQVLHRAPPSLSLGSLEFASAMSRDVTKRWEEFLDPAILRGRLISSSVYLAAFELLKDSIVDRIKSFYCFGFDGNGFLHDPEYESEVLSRNRSPAYASLDWLREHDVIGDSDLATFERLKACRNRVAHEMPRLITGQASAEHLVIFPDVVALLRKVEVWWIVNMELPTNPDFNHAEINEDEIMPGSIITLKLIP